MLLVLLAIYSTMPPFFALVSNAVSVVVPGVLSIAAYSMLLGLALVFDYNLASYTRRVGR
jgi:hypothetical protein